jgi:hypothetical protein
MKEQLTVDVKNFKSDVPVEVIAMSDLNTHGSWTRYFKTDGGPKSAFYMFVDRKGEVIRVGQTGQLYTRMQRYKGNANKLNWEDFGGRAFRLNEAYTWNEATHIVVQECADPDMVEYVTLCDYNFKYNTYGNT